MHTISMKLLESDMTVWHPRPKNAVCTLNPPFWATNVRNFYENSRVNTTSSWWHSTLQDGYDRVPFI